MFYGINKAPACKQRTNAAYTDRDKPMGGDGMRLGLVLTGTGAHAAAGAGALRALMERGIEPHCVCGMGGGAWPAALYALGKDAEEIREIIVHAEAAGKRLLLPGASARAILTGKKQALCDGRRLEKLLLMHAGHRVLSLADRTAVFPCRLARNGRRIVFSTRPFEPDDALLAMQASVSFAARAAMTMPPLLAPPAYMGSFLLGESDLAFAWRLSVQLGAQRVLMAVPDVSPKRKPDALDLVAIARQGGAQQAAREAQAGLLYMTMPETVGAADLDRASACELTGYFQAREQLDGLLEEMGMAGCRILPFERRPTALK